jgi:hypothetical protein
VYKNLGESGDNGDAGVDKTIKYGECKFGKEEKIW